MNNETERLLTRLRNADPGWPIYHALIRRIETLRFSRISDPFFGAYWTNPAPLVFGESDRNFSWPAWMPSYVPALYGMNAATYEMSGGFACNFDGSLAKRGALFSPAGNDTELGYPLLEVPSGIYSFQANESGASFFISDGALHQILFPDADDKQIKVLTSLEQFAQDAIESTLNGKPWFQKYSAGLHGKLID